MLLRFLLLLILSLPLLGQQTARIASYNILNYENNFSRDENFRQVIDEIDPDILLVQEIESIGAINHFLDEVMNHDGVEYDAGDYFNGPNTDNVIFYRTSRFEFISNTPIFTDPRHINRFEMVFLASGDTILFYGAHLKASQGSDNEQRRLTAINAFRQVTDNQDPGQAFLFMGDLNIYTSNEPAYQALLAGGQGNLGFVEDPIGRPGNWHNNASFANVHTQSTRTRSFGSGSGGGVDDRFDQILVSRHILPTTQINYVSGSYTTMGNDGLHFNDSINQLPNNAVPASIANALHYASDHLPVYLDLEFTGATAIREERPYVQGFQLHQNYPNPFNPSTTFVFELERSAAIDLKVFNITGQLVREMNFGKLPPGTHRRTLDFSAEPAGVYFYRVFDQTRKMILLK